VNSANLAGEFGRSGYDQPFNNTTSFVWELPFGNGRRFASQMNPVMEGIFGGWRVVGINTMTSGVPVNLSYSPSATFSVSASPTYRPNLTGDPLTPEDQRTINNYLNSATVEIPTDRTQPFGNAPRDVPRGPSYFQLDLGLHKALGLGRDNTSLQFRIEAFNLFNHTNFSTPNANRSNANFRTITSTFPARQTVGGEAAFLNHVHYQRPNDPTIQGELLERVGEIGTGKLVGRLSRDRSNGFLWIVGSSDPWIVGS
jgi:hypothetical protein